MSSDYEFKLPRPEISPEVISLLDNSMNEVIALPGVIAHRKRVGKTTIEAYSAGKPWYDYGQDKESNSEVVVPELQKVWVVRKWMDGDANRAGSGLLHVVHKFISPLPAEDLRSVMGRHKLGAKDIGVFDEGYTENIFTRSMKLDVSVDGFFGVAVRRELTPEMDMAKADPVDPDDYAKRAELDLFDELFEDMANDLKYSECDNVAVIETARLLSTFCLLELEKATIRQK